MQVLFTVSSALCVSNVNLLLIVSDSLYRDRCLDSSLILHLAVPLLPSVFATIFMSLCSLISDVGTVDFLLLNLLPASSSNVVVHSIVYSRVLNFPVPTAYNLLSSKHRGGFDFWYLLIQTLHPQAYACHRDKTEAASLDNSIQSFPRFTTRLPWTKERIVSNGRRSWLGASTRGLGLSTSHTIMSKNLEESSIRCSWQSSYILLDAILRDASHHRLG